MPASVTYRALSGPNAIPRGLSSPDATVVVVACGVFALVVCHVGVRLPSKPNTISKITSREAGCCFMFPSPTFIYSKLNKKYIRKPPHFESQLVEISRQENEFVGVMH
jgi:hypothetical protein